MLTKKIKLTKKVKAVKKEPSTKVTDQVHKERYSVYQADSVDVTTGLKPNSVGFIVFSPPFPKLYTYTNSKRDLGNSTGFQDFFDHFGFLSEQLYRVLKPGRICSVHLMQIPQMKEKDGVIGIHDFRGMMIAHMIEKGFIFHSETMIWKDPLLEVTRTKAMGLQHRQLEKDSAMCRAGLPDYIISFRKPGENQEPIEHPEGLTEYAGKWNNNLMNGVLSHNIWRQYASPVWLDIRQTRTLNYRIARDKNDEAHICPLQLDTVERLITLYSNKNDIVYSPFGGIGTEGYVALKMNRKSISCELKKSYYDINVKNHKAAVTSKNQTSLKLK